jgi:hypothetical protein
MMHNYNTFILEKMILESNIVYSNKIRNILSRIKDNKIATKLLEIENQDIDTISNFFDVKKDNDNFFTFTPDKIAQEILGSEKEMVRYIGHRGGWLTNNVEANAAIFDALGYKPETKEVYHPNGTELGEIISKKTSEKTGKTWCYVKFPGGQGVYNFEKLQSAKEDLKKTVFNKSRQEIRIGRAVRLLLNTVKFSYTDAEIEDFVNKFRSIVAIMNDVFARFQIVEGDDLGFWYNRKNYLHPGRGTLGGSCQAIGRLDWLEIYIKNPNTVRLLILKSEEDFDKIVGRALVWKLENGTYMMDYPYTSKDSDQKVFREYAKMNNWETYEESSRKTFVAYMIPNLEFEKYPSIDTMNSWDPSTGKISNKPFTGSHYIEWTNDEENNPEDEYDDYYDEDDDY